MRDEERGTRELPAEGTGASRHTGEPVDGRAGIEATAGIAGIPEQARPHPEEGADHAAATGFLDDGGRRDREGAAPSTPADGPDGIAPPRPQARAGRRTTGGTMSEHERDEQQDAQSVQRATQHDAQDRSGARAMFVELRGLKDGSPEYAELRNKLVRMHLPLVEHLARRFRNRGEPLDDLTQVATIGLIKSVDRFDPDRGVEFSTYATPTVVGEIKRHFRDKGWAVRVPRRLQELRLALTTATAELSQQHGRSPTVHELAEKLAISEEEVLEGLESANAYSTLSLDVPDTDDESPAVADTLGAEDEALEGVEYRESLKPLLEDLPPREKRILLLRFFGNMTQSQIAQEVGISQMHVSRLLARTLAQLREKLLVEE
ncbi:RNA polymerase sigma factor SigF [Streptomyces gilvus]|uniref:RNA polymerase sigma factor SigF n=1 Tax=Streptomyces gilvus TaxID=2920937 RepID=UPI001F0ED107|nr:RNA polymerase sigma factor SigF [Streptomyces sp. CME 23]MCH5677360.1 RNA polymerase sigma factor SigF [Streptomyces sp. CME 23]